MKAAKIEREAAVVKLIRHMVRRRMWWLRHSGRRGAGERGEKNDAKLKREKMKRKGQLPWGLIYSASLLYFYILKLRRKNLNVLHFSVTNL